MLSYQHAEPRDVLGEALSKQFRGDSNPTAHTSEADALEAVNHSVQLYFEAAA